jgi:hypothetical protein
MVTMPGHNVSSGTGRGSEHDQRGPKVAGSPFMRMTVTAPHPGPGEHRAFSMLAYVWRRARDAEGAVLDFRQSHW